MAKRGTQILRKCDCPADSGDIIQKHKNMPRAKMIASFNRSVLGQFMTNAQLDDIAPTMILPQNRLNEVLRAFSEAVREKGFGYETESTAKGKLEATEKHLEDMRRLVFKADREVVISGKPII